jgi:hypothetical protein
MGPARTRATLQEPPPATRWEDSPAGRHPAIPQSGEQDAHRCQSEARTRPRRDASGPDDDVHLPASRPAGTAGSSTFGADTRLASFS